MGQLNDEFAGATPIDDEFAGAEPLQVADDSEPGLGENIGKLIFNTVAAGLGAKKAYKDTVKTAARYATKGVGLAFPETAQKYGYTDEDWQKSQDADAALMSIPAAKVGNIAGEIAMTAAPSESAYNAINGLYKGAKLLSKLGLMTLGGATVGAGSSAMTGHDTPEELAMAAVTGGVMSPVMHGIAKGGGMAWDWYKRHPYNHKNIVTNYLQNQFRKQPGVSAALRNLKSEIGENLTAGRAALADDGAYPALKTLDDDATRGRMAGRWNQIEQANRDIRANILRRQAAPGVRPLDPVTGNPMPSEIGQDIIQNRTRYDASMNDPVIMNPSLNMALGGGLLTPADRLAGNVSSQQELLALARGNPLPGVSQVGVHDTIMNANANRVGKPYLPTRGTILPIDTISELQNVKQALAGSAQRARVGGTTNAANEIDATRRMLVKRMRKASPLFGEAEDHFAGLSRIQSQADYAGDLLRTLNPLPNGKQAFQPFLNRMDDTEGMLKAVGSADMYKTPEALFANAPRRLEEIKALRRAVEREVNYSNILGHKGLTDTLESGLSKGERMSPPLLSVPVTIAKRMMRIAGKGQEGKALDYLDELVFDPKAMADVIDSIPLNQRNSVVNYLRNLAAARGNQIVGGVTGSIGSQMGEQ